MEKPHEHVWFFPRSQIALFQTLSGPENDMQGEEGSCFSTCTTVKMWEMRKLSLTVYRTWDREPVLHTELFCLSPLCPSLIFFAQILFGPGVGPSFLTMKIFCHSRVSSKNLPLAYPLVNITDAAPGIAASTVLEVLCLLQGKSSFHFKML